MKTALDLVDEAVGDNQTAPDPPADNGGAPPDVMVCPYDGPDGKPCGQTFVGEGGRRSAKIKLNGHTVSVHRKTWDGKDVGPSGRKPGDGYWGKDEDKPPSTASTTKTEKKAAKKATAHVSSIVNDSNRAAIYTQSLATFGLLGHLAAGRWFDDYDLNVWTNGAPGLANALDAVGEQNEGLRRTCDLLLAGGTGGAYVQLILASAMIAVPIAAHHGLLPPATGERFGAMIGAMSAPSQAEPPPSGPSAAPDEGGAPPPNGKLPMEAWGMDEWREVLFAAPMNPTAQAVMQEALAGMPGGAIGVNVPDNLPGTETFTMPEDTHRGSITRPAEPDTAGATVPVGETVTA